MNTSDGCSEETSDRENLDLVVQLTLAKRNRIGDDDFFDESIGDTIRRTSTEDRMGRGGNYPLRTVLIEKARGLTQRTATRDLVVDHETGLSSDVSYQVNRDWLLVVANPTLVDDGERQVEPVRIATDVFRLPHIGGDEDPPFEILSLQSVTDRTRPHELVHWNAEKTLRLGRVKIHRKHALGSRSFKKIRDEPGRDTDPRPIFLVASDVGDVGHYGRNARRRSRAQRIDHHQELEKMLVDRGTRGLYDENIALPHVLVDLHQHVLVAKFHGVAAPEGDPEPITYRLRESSIAAA